MDAREERLARNEALFREVNERIEQHAVRDGVDLHEYEFLCECSNIDCVLRLSMPLRVYEGVRSDPTHFVVAPGHELPEIEVVLRRAFGYQIVKKGGDAALLVAAHDPRS
jgi:hypothetical protein